MCFSAQASFIAAAVLVPAGALNIHRAYRTDPRYLPLAALPLFFGIQQLFEGFVWIAGAQGDSDLLKVSSRSYMFFAWVAWPVWIPLSVYFIEPSRRKILCLGAAIAGGMLGAAQYVPYFLHENWLVVRFLNYAVVYAGAEMLSLIVGQELTYAIYVTLLVTPLLLSSDKGIRPFGLLVALVLVITYLFFRYAYISVFCFGGAFISLYLVFLLARRNNRGAALRPA